MEATPAVQVRIVLNSIINYLTPFNADYTTMISGVKEIFRQNRDNLGQKLDKFVKFAIIYN